MRSTPLSDLLFTVRVAQDLSGAGVVLVPGLPDGHRLDPGEAVRLRRPDGSALVVTTGGVTIPARREPHMGARSYPLKVTSDITASDVPKGTQVWRMGSP